MKIYKLPNKIPSLDPNYLEEIKGSKLYNLLVNNDKKLFFRNIVRSYIYAKNNILMCVRSSLNEWAPSRKAKKAIPDDKELKKLVSDLKMNYDSISAEDEQGEDERMELIDNWLYNIYGGEDPSTDHWSYLETCLENSSEDNAIILSRWYSITGHYKIGL